MRRCATGVVIGLWLCSAALAAPQVGWWWNPSESGRGFFVESQNGVTFIAAYLYENDGHATWFVAGGPNADPYNYSGPLYNLSNGQTLFGGYVKPGGLTVGGQMSVHFDDDTHGTFTWPGGAVPIQREIFGSGAAQFQPYSGWWWNSSESGSGYSLELQGNNLFVVGFMYDDGGRPTWYFTAGPMSSPTTYHGDVTLFSGGQTMAGAYHPPSGASKVATLDVAFQAPDKATVTFTGVSAVTAMGAKISQERSDEIVREFVDLFTPFYTYYGGGATMNFDAQIPSQDIGGGAILSGTGKFTLTGSDMVWQIDSVEGQTIEAGGLQTATYVLLRGRFTLDVEIEDAITVPGLGTATCTIGGQATVDLLFPFTSSAVLKVSNLGSYTLNLSIDQSLIPVTDAETLHCVSPDGNIVNDLVPPLFPVPSLNASGTGVATGKVITIIEGALAKTMQPFPFGGTLTTTGDYDFTGTSDCEVVDTCSSGPQRSAVRGTSMRNHPGAF